MGAKRKDCSTTIEHKAAAEVIDFLISQGGSSTESNEDIAARSGLTLDQFNRGRRHSLVCSSGKLGGFAFGHRQRHGSLALIDPQVIKAGGLKALTIRASELRKAWDRDHNMAEVNRMLMVEVLRRAAEEASHDTSLTQLSNVLSQTADDVLKTGVIHPSTVALLDAAGVTL